MLYDNWIDKNFKQFATKKTNVAARKVLMAETQPNNHGICPVWHHNNDIKNNHWTISRIIAWYLAGLILELRHACTCIGYRHTRDCVHSMLMDTQALIFWAAANRMIEPPFVHSQTEPRRFFGLFKSRHWPDHMIPWLVLFTNPCSVIWPLWVWVFSWKIRNVLTILKDDSHDDVIKWKYFPRNWPFVHRSPVNSPHKGQWRGALMFSLICVWINDWVNNREAGDLRRYRAHYNVIVMLLVCFDENSVCGSII